MITKSRIKSKKLPTAIKISQDDIAEFRYNELAREQKEISRRIADLMEQQELTQKAVAQLTEQREKDGLEVVRVPQKSLEDPMNLSISSHHCIIVMFDVRSFSKWSSEESTRLFATEIVFSLIGHVGNVLRATGVDWWQKSLGDGGLYVSENKFRDTVDINTHYGKTLRIISDVNHYFQTKIENTPWINNAPSLPKLGWAISGGTVMRVEDGNYVDYYSPVINQAARLCDKARPSGIILHNDVAHLDVNRRLAKAVVSVKNPDVDIDAVVSNDVQNNDVKIL
jgi:hypothetical protein